MVKQWKDSRVEQPSPNHYDLYNVVFLLSEGHTMLGRAVWLPDAGYKTGKWADCHTTTGNNLGIYPVLYWLPHPAKPELI